MQAFKFGPQAALDLRRRRADSAERTLAEANTRAEAARIALDAARETCMDACQQAREEQGRVGAIAPLLWYQNWIAARQREAARREGELRQRRDEARTALDQATRARLDVRVLERLRDRHWQTYSREIGRTEQKAMDWLAVLRSVRLAREREEST